MMQQQLDGLKKMGNEEPMEKTALELHKNEILKTLKQAKHLEILRDYLVKEVEGRKMSNIGDALQAEMHAVLVKQLNDAADEFDDDYETQ